MKRKFYLVVTCTLLNVGSSIILQAMQEQEITEKTVLTSPAARNKFYYDLITERIDSNDFKGALNMLKRALERGFDVNYLDRKPGYLDHTLLHYIVSQAAVPESVELMRTLLEAGADPRKENNVRRQPLHMISKDTSPVIIEELVKAGADVNAQDVAGLTPLMTAIFYKNIPVIQTLVRVPGIDLMARDQYGGTAYDMVSTFPLRDLEIMKILTPYYMTLKDKAIEAVKKAREQGKIKQEEIKQRLSQELQEEIGIEPSIILEPRGIEEIPGVDWQLEAYE